MSAVSVACAGGASITPDRGSAGRLLYAWLLEYEVNVGRSDTPPATHWLVVDRDDNRAYVAPLALARRIVLAQALGPESS